MAGPLHMIEFAGLPGAGKTTFSVSLQLVAAERGYHSLGYAEVMAPLQGERLRRLILSPQFLSFLARRGRLAAALARFAGTLDYDEVRIGGRALKMFQASDPVSGLGDRRSLKWGNALRLFKEAFFIEWQKRRIGGNGVLLLDQGLFQSFWLLVCFSNSYDHDQLRSVMDLFRAFTGAVVVVKEIDPDEAARRILRRCSDQCAFDHMPYAELLKLFTATRSYFSDFVPQVAVGMGAEVIRVKHDMDMEEMMDLARRILPEPLRANSVERPTAG